MDPKTRRNQDGCSVTINGYRPSEPRFSDALSQEKGVAVGLRKDAVRPGGFPAKQVSGFTGGGL